MRNRRIDLSVPGPNASRKLVTLQERKVVLTCPGRRRDVHSAGGGHEPAGRLHCARASAAAVWTDQCRQAGGIRLQDYSFTTNPCRLDPEQSRQNSIISLGAFCITPPATLRQLGKVHGVSHTMLLLNAAVASCQSRLSVRHCNDRLYKKTATSPMKLQGRQDQQDIPAQLPAGCCKHKPAAY